MDGCAGRAGGESARGRGCAGGHGDFVDFGARRALLRGDGELGRGDELEDQAGAAGDGRDGEPGGDFAFGGPDCRGAAQQQLVHVRGHAVRCWGPRGGPLAGPGAPPRGHGEEHAVGARGGDFHGPRLEADAECHGCPDQDHRHGADHQPADPRALGVVGAAFCGFVAR